MNAEELGEFLTRFTLEPNGCWVWHAATNRKGYGRFLLCGSDRLAHRVAYTWCKGEIPPGLQIDHLCRNRACVNPDHLEAVTGKENVLRGVGLTAINTRKTHCPSGHLYDEQNTVINHRGHRRCRICKRNWHRAYLQRVRLSDPKAAR